MTNKKDGGINKLTGRFETRNTIESPATATAAKARKHTVRCPTCGEDHMIFGNGDIQACRRCGRLFDAEEGDPIRVNERINGGPPVEMTSASRATTVSVAP